MRPPLCRDWFQVAPIAACVVGLLFGGPGACTLESPDDDDLVLPDDDDAGDDDAGDDDAGDDDTGNDDTGDDDAGDDDAGDDDAGDDDDTTGLGAGPLVITWLIERLDLVAINEGDTTLFARAAFDANHNTGGFGNPLDDDGLPLPGAALHPELRSDLLATVSPQQEGCVPIQSSGAWTTPDSSDDAGSPVHLAAGGTTLELTQDSVGAAYTYSGLGTVTTDTWSLVAPGGSDWSATTLDGILESPTGPGHLLPTPGVLGNLPAVQVSWTAEGADGIEIVLVRYDTPVAGSAWTGVRCVAEDDGMFLVAASALAASGTGSVVMTVARANWTAQEGSSDGVTPGVHGGFVRATRFDMSVGG